MPCYSPLKGYRSRILSENGKRPIVFTPKDGYVDMPVELACGQCIGCRLEYSRQWAIRCVHEASLHDDNSFITLTYSNDSLPTDCGLRKKHFQDFMKRLRDRVSPVKVRYMACGEYGDKSNRPHYHAILFGYDFPDKVKLKETDEHTLYESKMLSGLWPYGLSSIGTVTFDSAAYVARYVMKKARGKHKDEIDPKTGLKPNERYDSVTGEIVDVIPEFLLSSRRPGLGHDWYKTFKSDVYPSDYCVINGKRVCVPRYYDNLLSKDDETELEQYKHKRKAAAQAFKSDNTLERLAVKHQVKISQLNQLERSI